MAAVISLGVLCGLCSTLFLGTLEFVASLKLQQSYYFLLLPLYGLLSVFLYKKWGGEGYRGNNLLIESYRENKDLLPKTLIPLIYFTTVLSHLGGASVGREGTAVQMGGGLSGRIYKAFRLDPKHLRTILLAGIAGGFGSVFGVPLAGAIFAFEFVNFKAFNLLNFGLSFLSAIIAHLVVLSLGLSHYKSQSPYIWSFGFKEIFWVIIAGVIFGVAARFFVVATKAFRYLLVRFLINPHVIIIFAGTLLAGLFYGSEAMRTYEGLSLSLLQKADAESVSRVDWILKSLLTSFSLAAGFRGGEVTPLLVIGQTLGNYLSQLIPLSLSVLTKLGFVAVFAGAAGAPLACAVMGAEIFGLDFLPYGLIACFISYKIAGKHRIYNNF